MSQPSDVGRLEPIRHPHPASHQQVSPGQASADQRWPEQGSSSRLDPGPLNPVRLNPTPLNKVMDEVRSGTYQPRVDEVAERVMAWLAPVPVAPT